MNTPSKPDRRCPVCNGPVKYYHGPGAVTRIVCKGTCPEWTVIEELNGFNNHSKLCLIAEEDESFV